MQALTYCGNLVVKNINIINNGKWWKSLRIVAVRKVTCQGLPVTTSQAHPKTLLPKDQHIPH